MLGIAFTLFMLPGLSILLALLLAQGAMYFGWRRARRTAPLAMPTAAVASEEPYFHAQTIERR
jgi:hypothetical protein